MQIAGVDSNSMTQLKCEYASSIAQQFNKMWEILGGNLFNDIC